MTNFLCLRCDYRNNRLYIIVFVMFSVFTWSGIQAAHADQFLDEIVEFTGGVFFIEHRVPAAIIAVVHNGEISIRGFGERAGKDSKEPDGETVIRIGSITKAFAGELLAHLAAGNIVQFAEPITRTCPELAENAKADVHNIRLIDLVTHAGGLPRELSLKPESEKASDAQSVLKTYTDWLKKEKLLFAPGKSLHYSNVGFDLLGLGLSRAANKSFPELMKKYISGPLNMKDTGFELSEGQKKRLMQGHGYDGEVFPSTPARFITGAAGGLYSTPNDLLKWMQWHLDRLGQKGTEVRLRDHALYLTRDGLSTVSGMDESGHMDAMGLGWVAMMPNGKRPFILQKAGGLQGTFSYIAFAPARGVAVFIAINKFDFAAAAAMAEVANDLISVLAPR